MSAWEQEIMRTAPSVEADENEGNWRKMWTPF
jgi:hypothetical protein